MPANPWGVIPYAPTAWFDPRQTNLPELVMQSGRDAANARLQSGGIWAGTIRDLGQLAGSTVGNILQQKAQKKQQLAQDSALVGLMSKSNGTPSVADVIRIYGPERGEKVYQGILSQAKLTEAVNTQRKLDEKEATDTALKFAHGLDSVSPELRAQLYPQARMLLNKAGLGALAQSLPDNYDETYWQKNVRPFLQSYDPSAAPKVQFGAPGSVPYVNGQPQAPIPALPPKTNYRPVETAAGIQPFDPATGQLGPVLAKGKPPAAMLGGIGGPAALSPEGIEYAATQYRVTGQMPPMGMGNSQGRVSIINAAAQQAKVLGQSPVAAIQRQAAYKADGAALTKMRSMSSAAESFETKALAQADIVEGLSDKVSRTQIPLINAALLSGKKQIAGDKNTQLLYNALTTFTTEYAKIMEGSTGSVAASSESARKAAAELISPALNKGTLAATLDLMRKEMRLTIQGYGATIDHITERMGGQPVSSQEPTGQVDWTYDPKTGKFEKVKH